VLAVLAVLGGSALPSGDVAAASTRDAPRQVAAVAAQSWTVYHHDLLGSGVDTSGTSLSPVTRAWTSPTLDGQLYGEPLAYGGSVFVATESDTVYALSATTGTVEWSRHLGTAVPAGYLPCGDIGPTVGVTGTPVIDPRRRELFAVALEMVGGAPVHVLVGLRLGNGAVELTQHVDPSGTTPAAQLQRTGLTLDKGRVVFGLGGNFGDCGSYHGWVVAVPEIGGGGRTFEVDAAPGTDQGAIWMGGAAPVVDAHGNVWVAAGNGSVTTRAPYDDSDSVLELSPTLRLLQSFAPSDWYRQNATDADLGSSPPALVGDGLVLQAGKSGTAYLLRKAALGGIGGQVAELGSACAGDVSGGEAFTGDVVYLPCQAGLEAVRAEASPPAVTKLWQTATGASGPPVIAGGLVWTVSQPGVLYGLSPATGATEQHLTVGPVANHFPTPSVGDHLLLVAGATRVLAFRGPA
jgi:outer membrane protein assembly factor BamB